MEGVTSSLHIYTLICQVSSGSQNISKSKIDDVKSDNTYCYYYYYY